MNLKYLPISMILGDTPMDLNNMGAHVELQNWWFRMIVHLGGGVLRLITFPTRVNSFLYPTHWIYRDWASGWIVSTAMLSTQLLWGTDPGTIWKIVMISACTSSFVFFNCTFFIWGFKCLGDYNIEDDIETQLNAARDNSDSLQDHENLRSEEEEGGRRFNSKRRHAAGGEEAICFNSPSI